MHVICHHRVGVELVMPVRRTTISTPLQRTKSVESTVRVEDIRGRQPRAIRRMVPQTVADCSARLALAAVAVV